MGLELTPTFPKMHQQMYNLTACAFPWIIIHASCIIIIQLACIIIHGNAQAVKLYICWCILGNVGVSSNPMQLVVYDEKLVYKCLCCCYIVTLGCCVMSYVQGFERLLACRGWDLKQMYVLYPKPSSQGLDAISRWQYIVYLKSLLVEE